MECKSGERELSRNISSFAPRSGIPLFHHVHLGTKEVAVPAARARILPLATFPTILGV